jgi:hypothetical protein
MAGYLSLANYYQLNFALMQHHNYNLADIDSMYPWEREIYVSLLNAYLEKQEEAARK